MTVLFWVVSVFGFVPMQDTVSLEQVEVYAAPLDRFAQGQKLVNFDSKVLEAYAARSLGDLLQEQSPVFVRQYGAGMLASPSFRGTSAGHTAIFWNGLPVNSPSLGQSDLSILPVEAIDQAQLHFGSSGALFGNEAIGGSLHLGSKTEFGKGFQGKISQTIGSFGLFNSAISGGFSSKMFSTKSRFYRQFAQNDFSYRDISRPGTPETKAQNAAVEQLGFVQDFAWNVSSKSQFKAAFWWNKADRQIQPVMGSNTTDRQSDENVRAVLDYFRFGTTSVWNLKTGFVRDNQFFNESQNQTRQFFLASDWDFAKGKSWQYKAGVRSTFIRGDLSTYAATDQRFEFYQSARWQTAENLTVSLNLRQFAYHDNFIPFLPGIGGDWKFWEGEKQELLLKASLGKGFKAPTLNDRFWNPGGNPDLLPEESVNGEIGLNWLKKGAFSWDQSLTYYRMQVENWIIWLPRGSIWSPENIREVQNQGIEYQGNAKWKSGKWNWEMGLSYTFSQALDLTSEPANPRQLPYTPQHQANGNLSAGIGGVAVNLSSFYVGQRAIGTGNARILDSYQIWNAGLRFTDLKWGKTRFPISFQVLNLLDRDYQVLYLRAMPGRSYQLNLTIHL
ncbi:MAG: TonB-dependent receptor [Algoriphagus sp.]|uniref:TonB-dependent receptor plug domain-containing protein n=1 Tax=Algoriphagus sp. TaxID=1872435 RepID=UPI002730DC32|nr:TonB-dependent receptor [Algoriphagus sp.]MDP2041746.1 TonB-dependent receptor [Algoriphagus sp.]MDP3473649.1 TonB-dependent receptor [Algoriphagus sp.]